MFGFAVQKYIHLQNMLNISQIEAKFDSQVGNFQYAMDTIQYVYNITSLIELKYWR